MALDKYAFYERAVQSPEHHAHWFKSVYRDIHEREPFKLREDFCGTFRICCEWVKQDEKKSAVGLDLDPEPLHYGKKKHLKKLKPHQRRRIKVLKQNVMHPSQMAVDIIAACNFSFFIFHRRQELIAYFKSCLKSLAKDGLLILEMAGGPGMIEQIRERKSFKKGTTPPFTYIWDQRSFNPITRQAHYAIHFRLKDGRRIDSAFTYDWRLWSLPEVRDILEEVGFKETHAYWELEHRGKGTGEFARTTDGDNAYAWTAYMVAVK